MKAPDPVNPTDDDARTMARGLLENTRFGALAVSHPDTRTPYVTRVALLWHGSAFITLISKLSTHTAALQSSPDCAVLIGEPGPKGDPLTHPRMTVSAHAETVEKPALKDVWLDAIPKARLYYDFTDFVMYRLTPTGFDLNGGFGKAYRLSLRDLAV